MNFPSPNGLRTTGHGDCSPRVSPSRNAAIRGIKPEAALDHALRAVEEGGRGGPTVHFAELLAAMEAAIGPDEPELIRPRLAKLPPGTPRDRWNYS